MFQHIKLWFPSAEGVETSVSASSSTVASQVQLLEADEFELAYQSSLEQDSLRVVFDPIDGCQLSTMHLNLYNSEGRLRLPEAKFQDLFDSTAELTMLNKALAERSELVDKRNCHPLTVNEKLRHPYVFSQVEMVFFGLPKRFGIRGESIRAGSMIMVFGGHYYTDSEEAKKRISQLEAFFHQQWIASGKNGSPKPIHMIHTYDDTGSSVKASSTKPIIDTHFQNPHKFGPASILNHASGDEQNAHIIRHSHQGRVYIIVFAIKDINREEIFFNYGSPGINDLVFPNAKLSNTGNEAKGIEFEVTI